MVPGPVVGFAGGLSCANDIVEQAKRARVYASRIFIADLQAAVYTDMGRLLNVPANSAIDQR
jgi:hypothetical protein